MDSSRHSRRISRDDGEADDFYEKRHARNVGSSQRESENLTREAQEGKRKRYPEQDGDKRRGQYSSSSDFRQVGEQRKEPGYHPASVDRRGYVNKETDSDAGHSLRRTKKDEEDKRILTSRGWKDHEENPRNEKDSTSGRSRYVSERRERHGRDEDVPERRQEGKAAPSGEIERRRPSEQGNGRLQESRNGFTFAFF